MFTMSMFFSRTKEGPVTIHAPEGDHYRWRLEGLARTGVARQGADIPPAELLEGLKVQELRKIGAMLPEPVKFQKKLNGCAKIAEAVDDVSAVLPPDYYLSDFFRLMPITMAEIRARWG
jgi:hypothetical protein